MERCRLLGPPPRDAFPEVYLVPSLGGRVLLTQLTKHDLLEKGPNRPPGRRPEEAAALHEGRRLKAPLLVPGAAPPQEAILFLAEVKDAPGQMTGLAPLNPMREPFLHALNIRAGGRIFRRGHVLRSGHILQIVLSRLSLLQNPTIVPN